MIITCVDCGHIRGGVLCGENAPCPKCGGKKIDVRPCVEGPKGAEGQPGLGPADRLDLFEGDRIGECQLLRRQGGDRHCIVAFFTVRRGTSRLDVFVAGTGKLQSRTALTPEFVQAFMQDMRQFSLKRNDLDYPVEWDVVNLQSCCSVEDDVRALQRAGVGIWTGKSKLSP